MHIHPQVLALLTASMLAVVPAFCQTPTQPEASAAAASSVPGRADPTNANATIAALIYRSAFEGYRPNVEVEVGPWKDANDNVGRIGGWRTYARQARQPDAAASAAGEPKPAPAGHPGHPTQ